MGAVGEVEVPENIIWNLRLQRGGKFISKSIALPKKTGDALTCWSKEFKWRDDGFSRQTSLGESELFFSLPQSSH